jgi:uncharacterized protein YlxP (DUF503 family)
MIVGKLTLEIFLPNATNLKEKRRIVNSLKDNLRNNFKISVAEVDYENLWQRSKFLIAIASKDHLNLERKIQKIFEFLKDNSEIEITSFKKEYF